MYASSSACEVVSQLEIEVLVTLRVWAEGGQAKQGPYFCLDHHI